MTHGDSLTQSSSGLSNASTLQLEEQRLQQAAAQRYLNHVSQTKKLHDAIPDEHTWQPESLPHRSELRGATTFVVLPRAHTEDMPHWLIEFIFLDSTIPPLGIELAGECAVGLARVG